MDANMDVSLENMETENIQLSDSMRDLQAENNHLEEQVNALETRLEKEKKFHRKFAEEVAATEAIRIEDFRKEKREILDQNKTLVKENRQLKKDVDFYKKAHEELAKEETSTVANCSKPSGQLHQQPASSSKSTLRPESQSIVYRSLPSECSHKSSKVLSKANDKLFEENKKLKLKISRLNATISTIKKKNKQLENFRIKIDNKKAKFFQDSEELARLVASTQKKNEFTFNPEALAMLGRLPQK